MKKIVFHFVFLFFISSIGYAQIGIGTNTIDPSAELEVISTSKGFLPPRLTNAQLLAISTPAEGLLAYCTDCEIKGLYCFNGIEFLSIRNSFPANTASKNAVAVLVANCNNPADGNPSLADFTALGITNLIPANLNDYEETIANALQQPISLTALQEIIDLVNL